MGVDHKPGFLKQTNKSHKHGCHKSKRAIDKEAKGKIQNIVFTIPSCLHLFCFQEKFQRKLYQEPKVLCHGTKEDYEQIT
jgi:hypothetical protein